jgi:hypothetical protein
LERGKQYVTPTYKYFLDLVPDQTISVTSSVTMSLSDDKVIHGDPEYGDKERKDSFAAKVHRQLSVTSLDDGSTKDGQLFSMVDVDPALDAKMHIVNNVCELRLLFYEKLSD